MDIFSSFCMIVQIFIVCLRRKTLGSFWSYYKLRRSWRFGINLNLLLLRRKCHFLEINKFLVQISCWWLFTSCIIVVVIITMIPTLISTIFFLIKNLLVLLLYVKLALTLLIAIVTKCKVCSLSWRFSEVIWNFIQWYLLCFFMIILLKCCLLRSWGYCNC